MRLPERTSSSILLTIALPTFEQVEQLRSGRPFLEAILKRFDGEVELLIQDNCSSDGTRSELESMWPFAKIQYNSSNIGLVSSVSHLVERAEGEWFWIVGSGDHPDLEQMKTVLDRLRACDRKVGILVSGAYDAFSPFLPGQIFRKDALRVCIRQNFAHPESDTWPHLEWANRIRLAGWSVSRINLSVSASTGDDDWHSKPMLPVALQLLRQLQSYEPPFRTSDDVVRAKQTSISWHIQDRLSQKVPPMSRAVMELLGALSWGAFNPYNFLRIAIANTFSARFLKRAIKAFRRVRLLG